MCQFSKARAPRARILASPMALLGEDPSQVCPQDRHLSFLETHADPSDLPFLKRREIFAKTEQASVAFNILFGKTVPLTGPSLSRDLRTSKSAPQLLWKAPTAPVLDVADSSPVGKPEADVEDCCFKHRAHNEEEESWCQAGERDQAEADKEGDSDEGEALENLLARTTPCAERYPFTLSQSSAAQRIQSHSGSWTTIKGLSLAVRLANPDDCILLVARCALTAEVPQSEHELAVLRGSSPVSPTFRGHSRQEQCQHALCLPFVDQPNRRGEETYSTGANGGGSSGSFWISIAKQRRQFFALTVPAYQVAWVEEDEHQAIVPGPWSDIDGLANVVTTLPGDRVLAICTIPYAASWATEMNRGRFTLVRDDLGLDGPADRGLQSVRALAPQLRRTALMATVDVPPPGAHCYRARAALTSEQITGNRISLEGPRRLTLIRLPSSLVSGPSFVEGPITVEGGKWTEIPGLSVTVETKRPRDRVLIVYNTDCHPLDFFYKAHFTVRRHTAASGLPACLGHSEDDGLETVCSDYCASSEYPVGLLCDAPSTVGTFTYCVLARVANMGTGSETPAVRVGFTGTVTAVRLSS